MSSTPLPTHLVDTEPQLLTLHNAFASQFTIIGRDPSQHPEIPGHIRTFTLGCLHDSAGRRIDLSQRKGGLFGDTVLAIDPPQLEAPAAIERRRGRTLYLGHFLTQYGHFITEFLSRLWPVKDAAEFDHIVVLPFVFGHGVYRPRRFHRYLTGLLGLPLARLEILRAPVGFDEVVVPEQLWVINGHVNSHLRELYARIRDPHIEAQTAGRIFLSRATTPGGRLGNGREVEEVFASFGFSVLHPQELGIARQLRLYANCEIMAGLSGSGMHNCLFARDGTTIIDVGDKRARTRSVRMQLMANELAAVKAAFIPYAGGEDGRTDIGTLRRQLADLLGEKPRSGRVFILRLRRIAERLVSPGKVRRRESRR